MLGNTWKITSNKSHPEMAIVIIFQSPVETKSKTFAIQPIVTVPLLPMRAALCPRGALAGAPRGPCPVGLACASISQTNRGGRGHNQGGQRARRWGRAAGKPAKWQRAEWAASASAAPRTSLMSCPRTAWMPGEHKTPLPGRRQKFVNVAF